MPSFVVPGVPARDMAKLERDVRGGGGLVLVPGGEEMRQ